MTIEQIKSEYRPGDFRLIEQKTGLHYNTVRNHYSGKHRPEAQTERLLLEAWADLIEERRMWRAEIQKRLNSHQ